MRPDAHAEIRHSSRGSLRSSPSGDVGVRALRSQRRVLIGLIAVHLEGDGRADVFMRDTLRPLMIGRERLCRGETVVAWLQRVVSVALAADIGNPTAVRLRAIRELVQALLPALCPRYGELIRRLDLNGESKAGLAREFGITTATADVLLHRARRALRKRIGAVCALDLPKRSLVNPSPRCGATSL